MIHTKQIFKQPGIPAHTQATGLAGVLLTLLLISACSSNNSNPSPASSSASTSAQASQSQGHAEHAADSFVIQSDQGESVVAQPVTTFDEPWAMSFLPSGELLVTQKTGELFLVTSAGVKTPVKGVPSVAYGGQGGLGDVVVDPDFAQNQTVWLSYIQSIDGEYGAVVIKAKLKTTGEPELTQIQQIWEQQPLMSGQGHYSHRIAVGPAATEHAGYVFITSGDRQKQTPAQNFSGNLGKVIRLKTDGSLPASNPWQNQTQIAKEFYTRGHRNLLGIDFDSKGQLWAHEMGPRHGDELNRLLIGKNYGWPLVSNGDNYSGVPIADHDTRPEFEAPEVFWVPAISPSGLSIYASDLFPQWQGDALIGGLSAQALVQVDLDTLKEKQRFSWGSRVREVETGPSGAVWVLEDKSAARLLKLSPSPTS